MSENEDGGVAELMPFHRSRSAFIVPNGQEKELAIFDCGPTNSNNLGSRKKRRRQGDELADDEDGEDENKISRVAYVDLPLQFLTEEQELGFASNSRMGVSSTMVLAPQWTGSLSSFADIRGEQSGYTQAKVELDYELPSSAMSLAKNYLPSCEKANVNFGIQARGFHQGHVGAKVVLRSESCPWILQRFTKICPGDLTLSARYSDWLNRTMSGDLPGESLGQTTITASQKCGLCTIESTCTVPNNWWFVSPSLDFSISSVPSYHPWSIRAGWRWYRHRDESIQPFWNISLTPKLSDILSIHFNAVWTSTKGLTTTWLWKQDLGSEGGDPMETPNMSKQSSKWSKKREKSLQLGVQTNWMVYRLAALVVWTDSDFRLRIPIGLVPHPQQQQPDGSWFAFSLQSLFLTVLTRVIQDGLADMFHLHVAQTQAKETAQQQAQLQRQKAMGDALKQQHLMKRQAQIRREEEGQTGLVIQKAVYGTNLEFLRNQKRKTMTATTNNLNTCGDVPIATTNNNNDTNNSNGTTNDMMEAFSLGILDVTIPLQFWVQQGKLELPILSKRNLLGFCDLRAWQLPDGGTQQQQQQQNNTDSSPSSSLLSLSSTGGMSSWWKGFVTRQKTLKDLAKDVQSPLELYIQYDCGGCSYEITIQDEEGIELPSSQAYRIIQT